MAHHTYIAELEPADGGGFGVYFPDLPGCTSFGNTLDHAMKQAAEALSLHLTGMLEDEEPFPAPRELSELYLADDRAAPGVWAAITADIDDKGERVNVYLPRSLLRQIEMFGERTGIDNRSTFFRLAARVFLNREEPRTQVFEKLDAAAAGLLAAEKAQRAISGK